MSARPRPGRVPNDLAVRLDQATPSRIERLLAKRVARALGGRLPDWYRGERLRHLSAQLDHAYEVPELERALDLLHAVGYGQPLVKRRQDRNHGSRLQDRLDGVVGLLPRALALRYPTTDDRRASGPLEGVDVYGGVQVNHTPRDGHLGLIAATVGLWRQRNTNEPWVDLTRGELAYLLRAGRRITRRAGGGDVEWIDALLSDLASEQLTADVRRGRSGEASKAHAIPSAPIVRVQAKIDGHFLDWEAYRELADHQSMAGRCGQHSTLRLHLAPWVVAEITHPERRPVYINMATWRGLSGTGRRLYAYLQASTVDRIDGHPGIYFYLAPALRFTLGLRGGRADKAALIVRHQLTELYHRDERYHHQTTRDPSGFRQVTHTGTKLPGFLMRVQRSQQSRPRAGWRDRAPSPRRPQCVRSPDPRAVVSPYDVTPEQVPAELKASGGFDAARRHIAHIRTQALLSLPAMPSQTVVAATGPPRTGRRAREHPPAP